MGGDINDPKKVVPRGALRRGARDVLGATVYRRLASIRDGAAFRLSHSTPSARRNAARLREFRNRHRGETAVLIGNGPSLRKMDLSALASIPTFGLNRIYLHFPSMTFATTYLVCMNELVLRQCAEDLGTITVPKFLNWKTRDAFRGTQQTTFIHPRTTPSFSTRIDETGAWEGATVTFVALQIAYYMGFRRIVLVGVDHSFTTQGPPHAVVTSESDDPNHFSPAYFGRGFKWQLPDLVTSEIAYTLAKNAFEGDGRQIVDATVGGKLDIFPKVEYSDVLAGLER